MYLAGVICNFLSARLNAGQRELVHKSPWWPSCDISRTGAVPICNNKLLMKCNNPKQNLFQQTL